MVCMQWRSLQRFAFSVLIFATLQTHAAQVVNFYPTGAVKRVQQVMVRFSSEIVAMGDPRTNHEPFAVTCNVTTKKEPTHGRQSTQPTETPKYTTRWADAKSWVLDFEKPLSAGMRCTFGLTDMRDLSGARLEGAPEYVFSTAGPALLGVAPIYGDIEPEQYFVALTDGAMDESSLKATAYFEVEGMPDKVAVKIIEGQDREKVIRAAIEHNWRWRNYDKLLNQKPAKAFSQIKEMENFIILAGTRRFPEQAKVVLHWPKGILSKTGLPVEEAQQFEFKVIESFEARFSCERSIADRPCNPIQAMRVNFTKRVLLQSLRGAKLTAGNGRTWTPEEFKKKDKTEEYVETLTFKPPFPDTTVFNVVLPAKVQDELGRSLSNEDKYPLVVATDEYLPLIKFAADFGVLELKADPILPVSVRNVEKQMAIQQLTYEGQSLNLSSQSKMAEIISWYKKIKQREYRYEERGQPLLKAGEGHKFQMPKPMGEREFELMGIPLKKPGFYVVEVASPRLGGALLGQGTMYVATGALVTDMAVHFKKGRESSLIWVTQLSNAKPVSEAKVAIIDYQGRELAKGTTNADGFFRTGAVNYPCSKSESDDDAESYDYQSCEVFAFAQKGEDVSFASSDWAKGIEAYRYNINTEYLDKWGPKVMHTVLDRMAAQPGDKIHMKHVVREHHETSFSMMNEKSLPKRVLVVHHGSKKTYTLQFDYDKSTGTAVGEWVIPKDAALGTYEIYLSNQDKMPQRQQGDEEDPFDWSSQKTGQFIVTEYRLPLMKATVKIQGEPLVRPSDVKVDLSASYLSGGPAKGLKVKLRASLEESRFKPDVPGGHDYRFFTKPLKPGVIENEDRDEREDKFFKVQDLVLGADGGLLAKVSALPSVTQIHQLNVEMEYTDPNGEVKTAASNVKIFPAKYVVGLRTESWYTDSDKIKVTGVVTDNEGKPKAGRNYIVEAFRTNFVTHRKRLVGGFYSYDSKNEVIAIGKVCEGQSDINGRFDCAPKGQFEGSMSFQAKTVDDNGHATYANASVSVRTPGSDDWYTPSDSDRIDLLPEKTRYEPGEKAKLIVRSPFATSTVLVTVEREGVLEAFVTELKRDNPVIEVPLKGHYAPNVYVSALALRGRVGDPKPTALIDLARPAMKMGYAMLKVGWRAHELNVSVKPDKNKYRTREKAQVIIRVKTASGEALPTGSEVAVAAVDEALLRLKENTSWQILSEMMGERSLAVNTSSAQNQVVGRRHFGSKAKAPGGSGGLMTADNRENFEPMLLWLPRVKLNSSGEAKVTVPLNDSLTSFRIVAVAVGGDNFFGDGSAVVESSKDLILYSGFAPLAREGDQIKNAFTLRNTTAKPMKVVIDVNVNGTAMAPKLASVDLKPSEAKTLELPLTIAMGAKEVAFQLKAKDTASGAEDALVTKMRVEPAVPARVLQATLFQVDKTHKISVQQPRDALLGPGGLYITGSATLLSGLAGVKSYMMAYPYTCLEQKVSRAVVLEDKSEVHRLVESLPTYFDSQGLLKFFPSMRCGSAQLTRYVMNILAANGYELPSATRTKLVDGLSAAVHARNNCISWWDEAVRNPFIGEGKILLMETLSRYKAFSPAYMSTVQITPNVWKTETVAAWFQLLKRESSIPERGEHLKKAENILRSRMNFQGSIMNLQGDLDWEARWQLFTSRDQEALSVFGVAIDEAAWAEDVGRMARGVVAKQRQGHWDTSTANAWGVTHLRRFSEKFEKEKLSGETKVSAADVSGVFNWRATPSGEKKILNWPKGSKQKAVPVEWTHDGSGKPWMHFETVSAIPLKAPMDFGYKITRKMTPVVQSVAGVWHVGDVANVELTITAKNAQPWVVVRDAVPAGASHLGTGLDGTSNILDRAPKRSNAAGETEDWPTEYVEKSHAHFVSYAAYLARGTYRVNYRIRLNSAGDFKLPPTRVEAMYSPETFGENPNANWKIAR